MTLSHISCSYIIPYYIPSCQPTISKSNIIHILSIQIFISHDCPIYNTLIYFPFTSGSSPTSPLIHSYKMPLIYHPYAIHICSPSYSYQIPDTYINHLLHTLILHIHIIPPYITLRPYYILFPAHPYKTPHTIHISSPIIPSSYTVPVHPPHPHSIFISLIHIPHNCLTYRTPRNCFISSYFPSTTPVGRSHHLFSDFVSAASGADFSFSILCRRQQFPLPPDLSLPKADSTAGNSQNCVQSVYSVCQNYVKYMS